MYQQPLHSAIAHLNQQEINELIDGYISGVKAKFLVERFKLKVHVTQIRKILPAMLTGQSCPACGADMIRTVLPRMTQRAILGKERCSVCRHESGVACRCAKCVHEWQRQAVEVKARSRAQIIQAITVEQNEAPILNVSASDLSLEMAVALLGFVRCCPVDKSGVFTPMIDNPVPYAPTVALANELLATLCQSHLITVSERTSEREVVIEGGRLIYDPQRVHWIMSVADRKRLIESIEVAGLTEVWPEQWREQVAPLWLKIALAESRQFYDHQAATRGLQAQGDIAVTEMLSNLLRDFSVGQVYWAIWRGAQQTADFLVRKNPSKAHAANYMIGACQRCADHARAQEWDVPQFRRNYALPRSMISYVMFDVLLKIGERGFTEPVGMMELNPEFWK